MSAIGFSGGDPRKVNKAGDTMTGALVLAADPTNTLGAATKQYVDNAVTGGAQFSPCVVIAADADAPPEGTPPGTIVIRLQST